MREREKEQERKEKWWGVERDRGRGVRRKGQKCAFLYEQADKYWETEQQPPEEKTEGEWQEG